MQRSYMCNHAPGHTGLLTAQHTRGVLCSHLARRQVLARTADLTTAPLPPAKQPAPSIYQPKVVQLPYLNKNYIKPSADLPEDVFNAPRQASALVYDPAIVGETVPAIIYGHGFSQAPDNYASTLELLRQQGWLVIAPKTDLLDTLWRQIEGAGAKAKMPGQLQTALILDMLRSLQFLREDPAYKGRIGKVAFFGHSMGAAGAIVAASKVKEEDAMGVTVLAPAANSMEHTLINDGIWLNGSPASIEATLNFFEKEFPESCPLTLVRGSGDLIVPPPVVARLFSIAKGARKDEDVWLVTVDGNHTGFEDQLLLPTTVSLEGANIPFPISLIGASNLDRLIGGLLWALNGTVIKLVEFLEYKTYVLSFLINNSPKQKEEMRATITTSFKQIFTGEGFDLKEGSYEVELMSSIVPGKAPTVEEMFKRAELNMDFDATTTGLLVAYALAQAVNTVSAGKLLLQSIAAGGLDETTLGLAIITALSAGLIYDNTLLAAGRFIGEGRLLEDLSEFRFLGHSGAPLALIAGLNIAGRVGVAWATDPSLEGAVGLVILFFVGISSIRNGLLLELQSKWEKGTLRYTYSDKNPDVTRVIPVIVSTVGLAVTGVAAAVTDHSYWPLAAAPLAALALNALPSSNKGDSELGEQPPPFVAGNFAEVLLFGALVWAEAALLAAGK